MSRIGKLPIKIPAGVQVSTEGTEVKVKGAKGELSQILNEKISVAIEGDTITLDRVDESKESKSMHGLYRSLIDNMITGVSAGYRKEMELIGVGYRATSSGQELELVLGFSHNVLFQLPTEIKVTTEAERGKAPKIILESHDKQLIGQVAAKIRSFRKPEPYKGKGIKFVGEVIRRKAGKSASKK